MTEEPNSIGKPILLWAAIGAVVGGAIFLLLPKPDAPQATADAPQIVLPEVSSAAPAVETATTETVTTPVAAEAPETEVAEDAPEAPISDTAPVVVDDTPVLVQAPTFDTFRVEPNGSMVIAGRAQAGQVVDIMLAGEAIERVTADSNGNFVALPLAGPSDQPRRLSLLGDPDGVGIASETSYIVAPIAAPVIVAAAPEPEPTPTVGDAPVVAETAVAPVVADDTSAIDITPAAQPTVLQADADGVRVVQSGPSLTAPELDENVVLDAITYDPEGEVQLSGRASGDGAVQVYIDNEPLTVSPVTEGDWQIELPQIDTGIYTLRIDEVDEEGAVVSRIETPFKREEAEEVAAVLAEETAEEGFEVAVKTVQPGSTLWAIAEENLGSGIRYVEVFEANADLIRDPDLIYPGQIFRMPTATE